MLGSKLMAMAEPGAMVTRTQASATAIAVLRQRFGDRLQTGEALRRQHADTLTWIPNQPPDAVIWVETTDEVRDIVRVLPRTAPPSSLSARNVAGGPHQRPARRPIA